MSKEEKEKKLLTYKTFKRILANQRTQLLKEVREKVIPKPEEVNGQLMPRTWGMQELAKWQLKKLKDIEEGK